METCDRKPCGKTLGVTRWILKTRLGVKVLCSPSCYEEESKEERRREEFVQKLTLHNWNGS
jgi:hypothetical protein